MSTKTLKFAALLPTPYLMDNILKSLPVLPLVTLAPNNAGLGAAVTTQQMTVDQLTAWIASLTAPTLVLFTNAIAPNKNTAFGDLSEPVGSWYTEKTTTLGDVFIDVNGNLAIAGTSAEWNYTGTDPGETIIGWALIDVTA
jgi:hypothetical protein